MGYARYAAMIVTSATLMYGVMYLNTYQASHVWYSETRLYMTFLMAAIMAVVMLLFMRKMYQSRRINLGIIAGSVLVFLGGLWLVRSQETIDDIAYMKAMIPHHSIAIMTSERAHIRDPRVRELADKIIESQEREIREMEKLIEDIKQNPIPANAPDLLSYRKRGESAPGKL